MYDSCFKAFHHYCGAHGAVFVIIDLPGPPIESVDEISQAFRRGLDKLNDPWTAFDDRTGVTVSAAPPTCGGVALSLMAGPRRRIASGRCRCTRMRKAG